ncbi:aminotransferase class I/II-fold pyridoxal phosphate-dependent enzyme [Breoghania sp.]|uniref:pyridoxal phosphate-dependent aminotransferase n=1 Tax=Breoghania sp. TaxID=2065378 RepID=UPI00262BEF48|nr:aminotransferase class I/II-fold pyridoxal phosphate-dependent enzyme [Breoghania sp.]MDJ0930768.1 aminotransferase class I/II-fold pyridoxal phosphate-dependent enzyme [Breoghania sp.]
MDILEEACKREAANEKIIHMEIGQPGARAPATVIEAAQVALSDGYFGYTEARGIAPLRDRIARHYRETYGVDILENRIIVTTGSSAGFSFAFLGAFDSGDRVALTAPGYPAYRNILKALELEPVESPVEEETRWVLTPELLEWAHTEKPLKGVLVANPGNPSETMMQPVALKALCESTRDLGITFISDEIYHGLVYRGETASALNYSDEAIVINSFSKYYCMTGWWIGWMIALEALVRSIERIAQSLYICAPDISQRAALAAFDATPKLEVVKQCYAKNRELLLDVLPKIGFNELLPVDGAFYVYAGVRSLTNDSSNFARRMLAEAGIATTPSADFDHDRGPGYLCFSFAGLHEDMVEATERLARWLA